MPPPESHQPETLAARGLRVDRGGRAIVRDLAFVLRAGEALVVLGRNGAGKSTLLRALAGLLPLRAGTIDFSARQQPERQQSARQESARRDGVGGETPLAEQAHYIGHADGLKAALTALENLEFWARMLGASAVAPTPLQALQKVGLARIGDFPVGYLSAGQKRRVALARLFVAPRPVWLLDEPATALDVGSQQQLAQAMAEHRAGGGFIIAATHAPLGLADAQELRLDASRAASPAGAAG